MEILTTSFAEKSLIYLPAQKAIIGIIYVVPSLIKNQSTQVRNKSFLTNLIFSNYQKEKTSHSISNIRIY